MLFLPYCPFTVRFCFGFYAVGKGTMKQNTYGGEAKDQVDDASSYADTMSIGATETVYSDESEEEEELEEIVCCGRRLPPHLEFIPELTVTFFSILFASSKCTNYLVIHSLRLHSP